MPDNKPGLSAWFGLCQFLLFDLLLHKKLLDFTFFFFLFLSSPLLLETRLRHPTHIKHPRIIIQITRTSIKHLQARLHLLPKSIPEYNRPRISLLPLLPLRIQHWIESILLLLYIPIHEFSLEPHHQIVRKHSRIVFVVLIDLRENVFWVLSGHELIDEFIAIVFHEKILENGHHPGDFVVNYIIDGFEAE